MTHSGALLATLPACAVASLCGAWAWAVADRRAVRRRARPRRRGDADPGALQRRWIHLVRTLRAPHEARPGATAIAELLDTVARAVRSGTSLGAAITEAARDADGRVVLGPAMQRWRAGATLADALVPDGGLDVARPAPRRGRRADDPSVHLALVALAACATIGGPIADTVERAAATVRETAALDAERAAQASQARASMWVLTLVPIGSAAWSAATDAGVRAFLFTTPAGWACSVIGTALAGLGWRWMATIVGRPAR